MPATFENGNYRMGKRVLVVAEEVGLRATLARALQLAGYAVELAEDLNRALAVTRRGKIAAAIVALGPGSAGSARTRELRAIVPRMIVLADSTDEVVRPPRSLLTADAILLRPFDDQELLARLAQLVATPAREGDETEPAILCFEGRRLDLAGRAFVDVEGLETPLTRTESALLAAFVRNPCRGMSRDQLCRAGLGRGAESYDRNVDVLIGRLRRKIEPDPRAPRFILTVPGAGYKFAAQPHSTAGSGRPLREPHSEPERRQVTVLSCGLAGATAIAISFDLEDAGRAIRSFQDACTATITRMGGSIARLSGDEILAVFGYPQAHEDDAERAVHAGFDLMARVGQLLSTSGVPLQVQVGVATGLALVGGEQGIVGEPPAVAARLRIVAPPNSVIVTAGTRKLLGGGFVCENSGLHELAGVSDRAAAFRVTGRRAVKSRFEARRKERLTRLVGRQRELQQLLALWRRAKGGKGQVALLCGEAGIGKSRICEALLDRIAEEPHIAIRYQCSAHYANSPFHPVISQLEQLARFEPEDTPDVKLEKLEGVLPEAGAATLADAVFYASLLSIPADGRYPSPGLTPQRQKDLTITALIRQVLGLAHRHPLIIKLADAHWIDSSTLELLDRIIASITTASVLERYPNGLNRLGDSRIG